MACTAREAMAQVNRELDDLHRSKRDDKDFIGLLQTEISIIRDEKEDLEQEIEFMSGRVQSSDEMADFASLWMCYAYLWAFIATGFAVWNI